jgi:hypothetical protein
MNDIETSTAMQLAISDFIAIFGYFNERDFDEWLKE